MPETQLITRKMVEEAGNTDIYWLRMLGSKVICEDVMVYDKVMDKCAQLHLSAYGDRETLEIVI
jgi:uncharacterized protein YlxP (DUF503 family)